MGILAQKVYYLQGLRSESMTTHLFLFCIDWLPFRVSKGIYKSIDKYYQPFLLCNISTLYTTQNNCSFKLHVFKICKLTLC